MSTVDTAGTFVRVYRRNGRLAHLLPAHESPNDRTAHAVCGLTPGDFYWHGTGGFNETERADALPTCATCKALA